MYESLKLAVTALVLPPGGPLVLLVLAVLVWRQRPRISRVLAAAGTGILWLAALPIVAAALVTVLGGAEPLNLERAREADAIVIAGGGVRPQAPEYGGDTLGRLTLDRVRYGAYIARRTSLPVLVTGGAPEPGVRAEAALMREALENEFGVPVRWEESKASNTRENARNAAEILLTEGKRRVVLVVHGFDVQRARRQFEAAGLEVIPAPTQVPNWDYLEVADFLPSVGALVATHFALYEVLAIGRDAAAGQLSSLQ